MLQYRKADAFNFYRAAHEASLEAPAIRQDRIKKGSVLPVLLFLLLQLSLLFQALLRSLLAFFYPFAFLFHNTLLSSVFYVLALPFYGKKRPILPLAFLLS